MIHRTWLGTGCACLLIGVATARAEAVLDIVPASSGAPVHLHVSRTTAGASGPQTTSVDVTVRRVGPANVVVQRNADVSPLSIGADGTLRLDPAAPTATDPKLVDLIAALNIAHSVTAAPNAGDRSGWTAQIPLPAPDVTAGGVPSYGAPTTPSPPPPLLLPIRAMAAGTGGDVDIDGSAETTLAPPAAAPRPARSRGSGGFGRFGGRGDFSGGGRGGGDEGPRAPAAPPVTLDVHIDGRITHNALGHLIIAETRRVTLDGLTYTNVGTWSIDATQ
jgi:uncharacterized membrane protein YgcG